MKERLTGAIILVVLVVLLVPELLSGPKGPAATAPATGAASPSSEEPPLRSYTINLGDEHSQSQTANGSADSGPPQPSVQAQSTTTPSDKEANEASTTWDATAPTTTAQSSPPEAVQSPAPAPKEVKPTTPPPKPVVTPKPAQPAPTVRAEPAKPARAAAAEKPAAKPHAAAEEKPAAASAESGGWGVQLGVFGSEDNAERLVQQARVKGFKASVSPITSGKNKMYRVRVGPAADKAAAQELQTKLKAVGIAHPDAKVVPYS